MKYEIFYGKERKFCTNHEECLPRIEVLKQMKTDGYTILRDGKKWNMKKTEDKDEA